MHTVSDVPNPRTADADIPASDRRAALVANMQPCLLGSRQVHAFANR